MRASAARAIACPVLPGGKLTGRLLASAAEGRAGVIGVASRLEA